MSRPHHPLACIAMALAAAGVQAETGPYYIGASQTFTRESNLFRLTDTQKAAFDAAGGSSSDTISTTALIGGIDQTIGRQHVFGSAALRANRFGDNDDLNSQTYSLNLGVDWETVANLSGKLAVSADRNLRFDSVNEENQRVTERNAEKTERLEAIVRLGAQSRLRLEAGWTHRKVDYSLAATQFRNYSEDSVYGGVRYRPANAFTFGADLRRTEGSYPTRLINVAPSSPEDQLTRNQIDLITRWTPGGPSSVDARLSFGKTTYEQFANRNYSGATWALGWNWQPTGKLKLVSRLYRELGQNADIFSDITGDDSNKRTGLKVQADYELTGKVQLDGSIGVVRRARQVVFQRVGFELDGTDTFRQLSLGARWLPTRTTSLGCNVSTERRGTNSNDLLNEKYSANVFSCFGQFTLQP